ncbi:fumarylacetoacetate (FAA) hydrolase [Corchorus olitorius]|uniref:Fumarylacetoacetate (FAA) hydrolase n=1 Tax=Corchorus olitorius TaxID=93759 RepID=A0A1R3HFP4_9ROSI|nr:fumarylacetoacetate (FAA) hydrolase [Corchorus olitorius]
MPTPSGRCWQDAAGNFHGLKRGKSSHASVAKYKKNEEPAASDLSCRTTSQPQGPLRRSPRNLNKNPTAGSSMEVNQSSSCATKRKADDMVTIQGS